MRAILRRANPIRALLAAASVSLLAAAPVLPPGKAAPIPRPYDETADAHRAVDAAFAAAQARHHLVMLDFGGNWCPDCRMLAGVLEMPQLHAWLADHYEVVYIDVGRFTRNTDIPARWGIKLEAAPTVLVVTPEGKLLNPGHVFALADARSMNAQAVADLLATWSGG